MKRLSIVAMLLLVAACTKDQQLTTTFIPRPAPDDPTPAGIASSGSIAVSLCAAKVSCTSSRPTERTASRQTFSTSSVSMIALP